MIFLQINPYEIEDQGGKRINPELSIVNLSQVVEMMPSRKHNGPGVGAGTVLSLSDGRTIAANCTISDILNHIALVGEKCYCIDLNKYEKENVPDHSNEEPF